MVGGSDLVSWSLLLGIVVVGSKAVGGGEEEREKHAACRLPRSVYLE